MLDIRLHGEQQESNRMNCGTVLMRNTEANHAHKTDWRLAGKNDMFKSEDSLSRTLVY